MDAAEQYPNKRLLVHFIQPHYPFIGPTGQEHFDLDSLDFWDRVLRGEVDIPDDVLWNAYEENLEVVLPHVETLMEALDGENSGLGRPRRDDRRTVQSDSDDRVRPSERSPHRLPGDCPVAGVSQRRPS